MPPARSCLPYASPSPSRPWKSFTWSPPVTTISSVTPASRSASIACMTIGRSSTGRRCLFVIRVSGSRREPVPPARTTPFMAEAMLVPCGPGRAGSHRRPRAGRARLNPLLPGYPEHGGKAPTRTGKRRRGDRAALRRPVAGLPVLRGMRRGYRPEVDGYRTEDPPALTVVVELPGVDPNEVKVIASPQALLIAGERRRPKDCGQYQQMEIEYGPFQRQVTLAEDVDPEQATATYERGILHDRAARSLRSRAAGRAHRDRGDVPMSDVLTDTLDRGAPGRDRLSRRRCRSCRSRRRSSSRSR